MGFQIPQITLAALLSCLLLAPGRAHPGEGARPDVPRISRMTPATLDACSLSQERKVFLTGDFPEGTRVLLDGAAVPAAMTAAGEIAFALPPLASGLYRIEAVAPGNRRSLPQALFIDSTPKISRVMVGEDRVTAYELIIGGENFLFGSALLVNGIAVGTARREDPENPPLPGGGRDYLRYEDCSTLVYVRHPVTRITETVSLRIVNPGGEQSAEYEVEIP